jgi:hypothetical protein
MLNNGLLIEILKQILSSINTIERRMKTINTAEDFLKNERKLELSEINLRVKVGFIYSGN